MTAQTLNLPIKAGAEGRSLKAVCTDVPTGIDSNTLREHLNIALDVA